MCRAFAILSLSKTDWSTLKLLMESYCVLASKLSCAQGAPQRLQLSRGVCAVSCGVELRLQFVQQRRCVISRAAAQQTRGERKAASLRHAAQHARRRRRRVSAAVVVQAAPAVAQRRQQLRKQGMRNLNLRKRASTVA